MKNFLPDQWWFLMHTNNMERRLNETEFLEKVKNKREAATITKIWKRDATLFFQAEADLRIFASKVTSHQYLILWPKKSRTKQLKKIAILQILLVEETFRNMSLQLVKAAEDHNYDGEIATWDFQWTFPNVWIMCHYNRRHYHHHHRCHNHHYKLSKVLLFTITIMTNISVDITITNSPRFSCSPSPSWPPSATGTSLQRQSRARFSQCSIPW